LGEIKGCLKSKIELFENYLLAHFCFKKYFLNRPKMKVINKLPIINRGGYGRYRDTYSNQVILNKPYLVLLFYLYRVRNQQLIDESFQL